MVQVVMRKARTAKKISLPFLAFVILILGCSLGGLYSWWKLLFMAASNAGMNGTTTITIARMHGSSRTAKSISTTGTTATTTPKSSIGGGLNNKNRGNEAPIVVAYAVSVTGCGSDPITEGGAVLKHSIHRVSVRGGGQNHSSTGRYDYKLFAIYHPDAEACALPLQELGYTLLKRDVFLPVADIQGEFLREHIEANGCCGEKELIKLEAYMLTDYPIVVHLDLDVLVLKPLDDLFDMMLQGPQSVPHYKQFVMWPDRELPTTINAFYTLDYNMVAPRVPYKPVQGGFLVTRPDRDVYEEFRAIVREGDFRERSGWGGKVGPFHGSMTFQGIIPYYYHILHPGQSVELNRCIYNQMADNPRTGKTVKDIVSGDCRTSTKDCEDCRSRSIDDIVTTHYTICQKPWWCLPHQENVIQHRLCRKLTQEWYRVRSELEQSWDRPGQGTGDFEIDIFFGYCTRHGKSGYMPIGKPYGT